MTSSYHVAHSACSATLGIPTEVSFPHRPRRPIALARPTWSLQRPSICTQPAPNAVQNNNNGIDVRHTYTSHDAWVQALAERNIAFIEESGDDDESC
eukprot:scaffold4884_cov165-Amphora_coffeaeformis.AAC.1